MKESADRKNVWVICEMSSLSKYDMSQLERLRYGIPLIHKHDFLFVTYTFQSGLYRVSNVSSCYSSHIEDYSLYDSCYHCPDLINTLVHEISLKEHIRVGETQFYVGSSRFEEHTMGMSVLECDELWGKYFENNRKESELIPSCLL